uniref:Uncharacterized protein n=1 Tax=Glossina austeni TaxID=7395 RepID=A0A1A9UGQ3_GLOAU
MSKKTEQNPFHTFIGSAHTHRLYTAPPGRVYFERKETFHGYTPDYGHEMNKDLCLCANNCLLKLQNLKNCCLRNFVLSTVENVISLMRFIAQVTCKAIMGWFATQATNKKSVTKTFQRQRKNQCLLVCRTVRFI